ncbi:MAG: hypothetical protein M1831_002472 [Alyxoria varia]|nr:MAG: hypothetical protein M1831_002472 [Alyxoria varia]
MALRSNPNTFTSPTAIQWFLDLTLPEELEKTPYSSLVVGAAVFKPKPRTSKAHANDGRKNKTTGRGTQPSILLLKRTSYEPCCPDYFELPSGKMDKQLDANIYKALGRVVHEATGLYLNSSSDVLAVLQAIVYEDGDEVRSEHGTEREQERGDWMFPLRKNKTRQRNFTLKVDVYTNDVDPNPEEHSDYVWADMGDVETLKMTEPMRKVVRAGLKWAEENPEKILYNPGGWVGG